MTLPYPLAFYGYPDVEAEDPLACPNCHLLVDARFWGRAEASFMRPDETYREERGLVCPECRAFSDPKAVVDFTSDEE